MAKVIQELGHLQDTKTDITQMLGIRSRNAVIFLAIAALIAAPAAHADAAETITAKLGPQVALRWQQGPISFGMVLAGQVVSWSNPNTKDILISRCWEGVYLYPSGNLTAEELNRDPIRMCAPFTEITMGLPVDWNHDGKDELIVTNRLGGFFLLDRQGSYPSLKFPAGPCERDFKTGLEFKIPYENPNRSKLDNLGGYGKTDSGNYTYPIRYPPSGDKVDLIFGDWAGVLWWLADQSEGDCPNFRGHRGEAVVGENGTVLFAADRAHYSGTRYVKSDKKEFSKPADKICDESGEPFLLGEGNVGQNQFHGANTRPVVFRNSVTRSDDLLVLAGTEEQQVFYLKRINPTTERKPIFKNMGEVKFKGDGLNHPSSIMNLGFHTILIVIPSSDGRNDLFVSDGCRLAYYRNTRPDGELPEYQFSHYMSAPDSQMAMSCPTEILKDRRGNRYLLDNTGVHWEFFQIKTDGDRVRLVWPGIRLMDQNGVFKVEAETDPNAWKVWGYHRSARWDFDGSGRQHLVVGTDKGLLYLLIENEHTMDAPPIKFRSVGPLKDSSGQVIRIHNRAMASGIDLDGDGREDLIAGGIPYQMGAKTDPSPNGGFYYLINKGLDKDGLPVLEPMKPLPIEGYQLETPKNTHVQIQVVDLDHDGNKEVILASQRPDVHGRVFRLIKNGPGLEFTGKVLPGFSIRQHLVDIDGDGELELICGGGEHGIGWYSKFSF
jgi:hypothetical protein